MKGNITGPGQVRSNNNKETTILKEIITNNYIPLHIKTKQLFQALIASKENVN